MASALAAVLASGRPAQNARLRPPRAPKAIATPKRCDHHVDDQQDPGEPTVGIRIPQRAGDERADEGRDAPDEDRQPDGNVPTAGYHQPPERSDDQSRLAERIPMIAMIALLPVHPASEYRSSNLDSPR